ncbi:hypothetical protein CFK41_03965 [Brachybacterium ginsengisoli]|uniref:SdpI family protein n=1 Tax=Brachybacterium ginsengisoli TaxID=1331682 RepID=A0A291GV41_9MICO|nr:hypothetical protein [Brachybacterium ginsengisoli]ATG54022.1 hypothetical protein CFK41_03965 [Brachybacterium ginsengisoli]
MDPVIALFAAVVVLAGVVLAAMSTYFRGGRGAGARFWVDSTPDGQRSGHRYAESAVLVVLPLLAQLLLVVGVLVGVTSIDVLRDLGVGPVIAVVVIVEVVLMVVLLTATSYRTVMPLWVYPSWLRPRRKQERDQIRSR